MMDVRATIARTVASALDDQYDYAFPNKSEWVRCRGEAGGRFRDINEPFKCDYDSAAVAILALPEIQKWKRAYDEQVEMDRKLGHAIKS